MSLSELIKLTKIASANPNINKLILVRSCENMGALSGCLNGWLDTRLTEYGRKQAKHLSLEYFVNFKSSEFFSEIHTSDLLRSNETANISLAYDNLNYKTTQDLREIYFGTQEGFFYDGLSKEEKAKINKQNHKFPKGESWMDVKFRACRFLLGLQANRLQKPVLSFTHGGLISSLLYAKGHGKMPKPGTVTLVSYKSFTDDADKDRKQKVFFSCFNEFSNMLNCPDENFNESFFAKFNPVFEEFLKENIDKVECVYDVPDLTEEIF